MKNNTGKKRFLKDAHAYIEANGPATAEELHSALRFTATGKLLRDAPTRTQIQQILARCKTLKSSTVQVGYNDPTRYTSYGVKQYSIRGDE